MKILKFLACLSWLLLPAFANARPVRPIAQPPSLSLDHPERIMEERGQLDCLGHNFLDLDILRRHEATLSVYPEIRVGCETFSVKPFQLPLVPPPKPDKWWVYEEGNLNKKRPTRPDELAEKVQKYFVIDMYGNETQIQPESNVTVETYDLSQVKFSKGEPVILPSPLTTKLETFQFSHLCFPVACYEPGQTIAEECLSAAQMLSSEPAGGILRDCLENPNKDCDFVPAMIVTERRELNGKSGAAMAPNMTTYCSMETSDGPRLGPLTSDYTGLQALLSNRSQVPSDTFNYPDDQDGRKSNLSTSALLSGHSRTWEYRNKTFVSSCILTVPVEPPLNTSFAVDFFVANNPIAAEKPIKPGHQLQLNVLVKDDGKYDSSNPFSFFGYIEAVWEVKFEDVCFPAQCYQERTPAEAAVCQLQKPDTRTKLTYEDPSHGVEKLLWPTASYYERLIL